MPAYVAGASVLRSRELAGVVAAVCGLLLVGCEQTPTIKTEITAVTDALTTASTPQSATPTTTPSAPTSPRSTTTSSTTASHIQATVRGTITIQSCGPAPVGGICPSRGLTANNRAVGPDGRVGSSGNSGADGSYSLSLLPDAYTIEVLANSAPLPCTGNAITVSTGHATMADTSCTPARPIP